MRTIKGITDTEHGLFLIFIVLKITIENFLLFDERVDFFQLFVLQGET